VPPTIPAHGKPAANPNARSVTGETS